jgi:hypothetical protein
MLSDELVSGVAFLEAHKDELIAQYCEELKQFYADAEMIKWAATGSYNGLISRLKGTPLHIDNMQKPVRAVKDSGLSPETLIESAKALFNRFEAFLKSFSPAELNPQVREVLIYRVDKIVKQMISNVQMAALKQTVAELDNLKKPRD